MLSRSASYAMRRTSGVDARTVSTFYRVYRASILRQGYARHGDTLVRERGFACKAELLFKLARLGARLEEVPVVIDWSQREGDQQDARAPHDGRVHAADDAAGVRPPRARSPRERRPRTCRARPTARRRAWR